MGGDVHESEPREDGGSCVHGRDAELVDEREDPRGGEGDDEAAERAVRCPIVSQWKKKHAYTQRQKAWRDGRSTDMVDAITSALRECMMSTK